MKTNFKFIIFLCCILVSCQTSKKISYMQDAADRSVHEKMITPGISFQSNDMLSIIVSSQKPEMSEPFNLFSSVSQTTHGYLVDMEGYIDFPILGKIEVAGLSRAQLTENLKQRLIREDLIPDPIITIEILNFQISVLGEVTFPGTFTISGDRITILQALGKAGDLTIHGRRNNVLVQREEKDAITSFRVDLRSADLISSPVYYLQQNDVIYVDATGARAAQSRINENRTINILASLGSILLSMAIIIFN